MCTASASSSGTGPLTGSASAGRASPEDGCEKQAQEGRSPAAEHVSPVWIVTDNPRSSTTAVRLEKRQRCRINRDSHSYLPPSGQKTDLSRGAGLRQQTAALTGRPGR